MDHGESLQRIADLKSLASRTNNTFQVQNDQDYSVTVQGNLFAISIFDIWHSMKIKFTVMHTRIHGQQSIRLAGSLPELGNWDRVNPITLTEELDSRNTDELVAYS